MEFTPVDARIFTPRLKNGTEECSKFRARSAAAAGTRRADRGAESAQKYWRGGSGGLKWARRGMLSEPITL